MRNNNGVFSIGIIGLIVIIFSISAFFLLDIEKISVNIWALIFLLISEIALFCGLISLRIANENHNIVFLKTGISTALILYFISTFVSVFFTRMFNEKVNTFILIEFAIIVFFSIIIISFLTWSRSTANANKADIKKVGTNEPKRGRF